jgi:hypothetical protein
MVILDAFVDDTSLAFTDTDHEKTYNQTITARSKPQCKHGNVFFTHSWRSTDFEKLFLEQTDTGNGKTAAHNFELQPTAVRYRMTIRRDS